MNGELIGKYRKIGVIKSDYSNRKLHENRLVRIGEAIFAPKITNTFVFGSEFSNDFQQNIKTH